MIEYFLFIVGFFLLVKGADYLVEGSSSLAKKLGVPSLVVGLTVVAFGTSMPELLVSVFSALEGVTDVAIGNVVGSNIANILLILGLTATIYPLKVQSSTVWKEIPFSLMAVLILFIVANDLMIDKLGFSSLTRIDGILMLCFFGLFLYYVFEMAKNKKEKMKDKKLEIPKYSGQKIFLFIFFGLVGLFLGGKWVVEGAIFIAKQVGFSEFLISATVVALGTSLPEMVTALMAAIKKDVDLAVGGIIGSNIFNTFWILGITSVITPVVLSSFINFDIIFLTVMTLMLFLFMFVGKRHEVDRWQGLLFFILYITYIIFILMRG